MARRASLGLILFILLGLLAFVGPAPGYAAPTLEVVKRENSLNYPLSIQFGIQVRPSVAVATQPRADLEYQLVNGRSSRTIRATVNSLPANVLDLKVKLEARDFVFTGEKVRYRWVVTFEDGSKATTDIQDLLYFDNRFEWNDLEQGLEVVHWYNGDQTYASDLIKLSENQRDKLKQRFGLTSSDKYDVWFYDRQEPMTQVFTDPEIRNFLGVASPGQRVAVVLFPPAKSGTTRYTTYANTLEHELTHLVLNSYIGKAIPSWFDEGFATFVTEPHLDIRKGLVNKAAGTDSFISLQKLVSNSDFYNLNLDLAYSEASTLLAYLSTAYGDKFLIDTIEQYRKTNTFSISRIILNLRNSSLDELEKDWLAWLKDGTLPPPATPTATAASFLSPTLAPGQLAEATLPPLVTAPVATATGVPSATITPAPSNRPSATATSAASPPATEVAVAGPASSSPAPTEAARNTPAGLKNSGPTRGVSNLFPLVAILGTVLIFLGLGLAFTLARRR